MSSSVEKWLLVQIRVNATNPALLEGLEMWLHLGLLSDEQVRRLGQEYLCQPLPQPQPQKSEIEKTAENQQQETAAKKPSTQTSTAFIPRLLQSFKAELSVRWLLFLGLFMVVVSSGVLVASQWNEFPAVGQYGVLLAYTLVFCGATVGVSLRSCLPLTAAALKWLTLLLVPLNFWAIDGLGLWRSPLEGFTSAIAAILLTTITIFINHTQPFFGRHRPRQTALLILNQLVLSYLHLGWIFPIFPIIAVYLGVVATGVISLFLHRRETQSNLSLSFGLLPLSFLLWRAIFIAQVDVTQLGLAFGIWGGLLYLYSSIWLKRLAYGVLVLGWLISVETQPIQALAVSGISLAIFAQNLQKFWRRKDLTAIFIIALQTIWLIVRLVPVELRQQILNLATQVTNSQNTPWVLLSLIGLPYLIFMVGLTDWVRRRQQPNLALFGERLTLYYGISLTAISVINPIVRSLNLLVSTLTLAVVTKRRQPPKIFSIYLTHVCTLLTLASLINWQFPNLRIEDWAIILVVMMVVEWGILITVESRLPQFSTFSQSAWYIGVFLAGLSYYLLWVRLNLSLTSEAIVWLITPVALTVVSRRTSETRRTLATQLSILAAGMTQILTFGLPGLRLISWGVGVVVMIVNTFLYPILPAATLTVGFGLTFVGLCLWETIPNLTIAGGLVAVGASLTILWVFYNRMIGSSSHLARIYAVASESWAAAFCSFELISLTAYAVGIYWKLLTPSLVALLAVILTVIAVIIRSWSPAETASEDVESSPIRPHPLLIYTLGWSVELLLAHSLSFTENSLFNLSIANLILGLIIQWVGDYWQRRTSRYPLPNPWQVLPLFYGSFGTILRSGSFDNWTGLTILGLAVILTGVGRQSRELKPLVYLGLTGVSVAAYQLVYYNLSSAPISEQITAFAALGTTLLYLYRILSPWLTSYLYLSETEIKRIADLHWVLSSSFWLAGVVVYPELNHWIKLGIGLFLTRYAIMQGRHNSRPIEADIWVYLGLVEAAILITNFINRFGIGDLLIPWGGMITSGVCYFLYFLPWESWGWRIKPWRRVAIFLPVLTVIISDWFTPPRSDLAWYLSTGVTIIYYLILTQNRQNIRFSYLSLGLINFAFYRWLFSTAYNFDAILYATPIGLSLLYFAQLDPIFNTSEQKQLRHFIRMFGTLLICVTALLTHEWTGLIPGAFSLIAILAGLGLRVRAFLYIGTATFLVNAVNQFIILNSLYSFMKWMVGLMVGLILIWMAANFETRREQMVSLFQNWISELEEWQ